MRLYTTTIFNDRRPIWTGLENSSKFAEHVRVAARRSSYVPPYAKRLAINYACPASHVAVLRVCLINNESPVLDTLLNPSPE